jgi:hypothetical protein
MKIAQSSLVRAEAWNNFYRPGLDLDQTSAPPIDALVLIGKLDFTGGNTRA